MICTKKFRALRKKFARYNYYVLKRRTLCQ